MNMTEPLPIYLSKKPANVLVITRAKLIQDETLQISLERMFERDDADKWMPTRLRKQYKGWLKSAAPLAIICSAPLHHQILGTNFVLLEQDLTDLIDTLTKRKGDICVVTSGSESLKMCVAEILCNLPRVGGDTNQSHPLTLNPER